MEEKHQNINMERLVRILSREASPQEQDEHRLWLEASEENRRSFNQLQQLWLSMDKTSPENVLNIEEEWAKFRKEAGIINGNENKNFFLIPVFRIAAIVLLLIGLSFAGWWYFSPKTVRTGLAEVTDVTLPDGSVVSLNASSSLRYERNFNKEARKVRLTGEAFFKVTRNPHSPFIIEVNETEVKVLGTSFNIRTYKESGKVEVTVADGTVSFYRRKEEDNKIILKTGEKAAFDRNKTEFRRQINEDRNFISWKTRMMVFDNDSLTSVVKTIENVYHRQIYLDNPEIGAYRITTSFNNKDLETVLKVLGTTLGITSEEKDGKIILKSKLHSH